VCAPGLHATAHDPCRDRARAALIGAFVADAATMPLHWIYPTKQIRDIIGDAKPEFYEKPSSPFYSYKLGDLSPYGEEAFLLLRSIVEHGRVHVCSSL
jgi:ADP-ribosylglycohydrolase